MQSQQPIPLSLQSPEWYEHVVGSGKLILPFDPRKLSRSWLVLGSEDPETALMARFSSPPSFLDTTGTWIDEQSLGLEVVGEVGVRTLSSALPFDGQVRLIAALHGLFEEQGINSDAQIETVSRLFGEGELLERIRQQMKAEEPRAIYSEQILYSLARTAIFFGGTDMGWLKEDRYNYAAGRMLLAATSLAMDQSERLTGHPGDLNAADILLQMSGLASTEWLPSALGRTNRIFRTLARSEEAKKQDAYCPMDDWLRSSSGGIGIDLQLAFGLLLLGQSGPPKDADRLMVTPGLTIGDLDGYAHQFGVDADSIRGLVSGDRAWFQNEFREIESNLGLDEEQRSQGWNRVPFDEKPFLRVGEELILWSNPSIVSWITDGLFFRILNSAPSCKERSRFKTFYGWLFEEHIRTTLDSALGHSKLAAGGRVVKPFKYGKDRIETTDVIVDLGPDLVFFEVYSGRLNIRSRLIGEADEVAQNLDQLLVGKAQQLSNRIDDFYDGKYDLDGVDREAVRRIWPVVVVGGPLMLNELLGEVIDGRLAESFTRDGTQLFQVLSPGDVDILAGLLEKGHGLIEVLSARIGGHRWLDFKRFTHDSPFLPGTALPALTAESVNDVFKMVAEQAGLDPSKLDRMFRDQRWD